MPPQERKVMNSRDKFKKKTTADNIVKKFKDFEAA